MKVDFESHPIRAVCLVFITQLKEEPGTEGLSSDGPSKDKGDAGVPSRPDCLHYDFNNNFSQLSSLSTSVCLSLCFLNVCSWTDQGLYRVINMKMDGYLLFRV